MTEDGIDRSIYDEGGLDERGFYTEGAYIGAPESDADSSMDDQQSPQAVYFQSLLDRFSRLHDQLDSTPPQAALDRLDQNHAYHHSGSRDDGRKWRWRLFNTDPLPAQLASMDKATVFKLLKFILKDNGALGARAKITNRLSRWIWGLLAKVPVRGELTSEEVGLIRDLGKKAVYLCVEMRGVDVRALYAEGADDDDAETPGGDAGVDGAAARGPIIGPVMPSAGDGIEADKPVENAKPYEPMFNMVPNEAALEDINDGDVAAESELAQVEAMKARLLSRLDDDKADTDGDAAKAVYDDAALEEEERAKENAKITVDMIITVAGEAYGQRDLLEFREEW